MKLNDFKALLLNADSKLTRNRGAGTGNYTVWTPGGIDRSMSDDTTEDGVSRIYVERFTKIDDDPICSSLWEALEEEGIPFDYEHDHEVDTGYNHHTFTCYVILN